MSGISEGDLVVTPEIMEELERRISKARSEYPEPNPNFKALISEIGELAETLIDLDRYEDNTYSEALDVAVVALRIAHVEYHGESEDDCDTCGGKGQVDAAESEPVDYEVMKDCPDCTDDDSYDDPRPEDEELTVGVNAWRNTPDSVRVYISDIREKLQDVREERDRCHSGIKNCHERWQEEFNRRKKLQERIEEARELLEKFPSERGAQWIKFEGKDRVVIQPELLVEIEEFLSEDSDEGDGDNG